MRKIKIDIGHCLIIIFLTFATNISAKLTGSSLKLFDRENRESNLLSLPTQNYLFFGKANRLSSAQANVGYDFSILTLVSSSGRQYSFGFPALIHLYMLPERSIFFVDNFYAEFGIWFQLNLNKKITFRLSPFYHRSAHLSDGYLNNRGDDPNFTGNISEDKLSISNEMILLQALFNPISGFELEMAAGYYFHTVGRKNMRGRVELNAYYLILPKKIFSPIIFIKNEFIYEEKIRYGVDAAAGLSITNSSRRGLGLYLHLYNRPHPGQYYKEYENGIGIDIRFIN